MPPDSGDLVPRKFPRRADGFRHAVSGGLWLAPLVYLDSARFGPGWYGKVVSSDPDRLIAWARGKGLPLRALEHKSLALAYDPADLAALREVRRHAAQ